MPNERESQRATRERTIVEFTKRSGCYNPGDVAGFTAEQAASLQKRGAAKIMGKTTLGTPLALDGGAEAPAAHAGAAAAGEKSAPEGLTKAQLKNELEALGIAYPDNANRAELLALYESAQKQG